MQLAQQNQGPQVAMVENVEKRLLYIPLHDVHSPKNLGVNSIFLFTCCG